MVSTRRNALEHRRCRLGGCRIGELVTGTAPQCSNNSDTVRRSMTHSCMSRGRAHGNFPSIHPQPVGRGHVWGPVWYVLHRLTEGGDGSPLFERARNAHKAPAWDHLHMHNGRAFVLQRVSALTGCRVQGIPFPCVLLDLCRGLPANGLGLPANDRS